MRRYSAEGDLGSHPARSRKGLAMAWRSLWTLLRIRPAWMTQGYDEVQHQQGLSQPLLRLSWAAAESLCWPCLLLHTPCVISSTRPLERRQQWHPTPVLLPGKSHGRRSLVGCSPWGCEEPDTAERLHFHFSLSCIGEGNVSPLQCFCLENPRDGGAWWAAVYAVAQSRTRLKWLSNSRPLEHKWDMVTPLQWIEYWESHEMMRWARSLSRSLSPSLLHLSPTFPRRAASYRVVSFPMERTEVSGQQPLEWLWKGIHPQCGLEIRPQSWPAPREAACKGLWARSTQLSHIWVLDPQKLWVNKCPLF